MHGAGRHIVACRAVIAPVPIVPCPDGFTRANKFQAKSRKIAPTLPQVLESAAFAQSVAPGDRLNRHRFYRTRYRWDHPCVLPVVSMILPASSTGVPGAESSKELSLYIRDETGTAMAITALFSFFSRATRAADAAAATDASAGLAHESSPFYTGVVPSLAPVAWSGLAVSHRRRGRCDNPTRLYVAGVA